MTQHPAQPGDADPVERAGDDAHAPEVPPGESPAAGEEIARPLVAPKGVLIHSRGEERVPPKVDPWEHRRGEPRVFALLWTIFLFAATAITMLAVVARGIPGADSMRPAARALLVTVAIGISIVWPLVRLSQRRDAEPVGGTLHDLIVLLVPVQAVVWPQTMWWLARWPLEVVAAVALELSAWSLVFGGLIVLVYATDSRREVSLTQGELLRRMGWMVLIVVLVLGPAAGALMGDPSRPVRWWWMLSPITSVLELVRDRSWMGVSAAVYAGHWRMIGFTALAALPLWLLGALLARVQRHAGGVAGAGQGA